MLEYDGFTVGYELGQELLFPPRDKWEVMLRKDNQDGLPKALTSSAVKWILFAAHYDDFVIGIPFHKAATKLPFGEHVLFLQKKHQLQRVDIACVICPVCEWEGYVADPTVKGPYAHALDAKGALSRAATLPVKPCPGCGASLPGHPIWTGPVSKRELSIRRHMAFEGIDGQKVLCPDETGWQMIADGALLYGYEYSTVTPPIASTYRDWVSRYEGFRVVVSKRKSPGWVPAIWRPLLLMRFGSTWLRVHPVTAMCMRCPWTGRGVIHEDRDAYWEMDEKARAREREIVLRRVEPTCPRCHGPLRSGVLWIVESAP